MTQMNGQTIPKTVGCGDQVREQMRPPPGGNQEHLPVETIVELHPGLNLMLWTMGSLRLF